MGLVIYPPTLNWSYMRQRPQHMMLQFAKNGHTVLFFNKTSVEGPVVQEVTENLFVVQHPNFFLNEILPQLPSKRDTIYWTSWSRKIPHSNLFQTNTLIYDCVDDFPDWEQEEQMYAPLADAIVCTADHLKEKMKKLVQKQPIHLVPNGCEFEHFAQVKKQSRLHEIPEIPPHDGPRIGYIGAWAPWVNKKIMQALSREMPEAQIVIIGPNLRSDQPELGDNVFFLGHKSYESLPFYLRYIDVGIIPFAINRITHSTNPVKAYEYLATGKPVVSTPLPEVLKMKPYVLIADQPNQFVKAVRTALVNLKKNSRKRMSFAKQHSWEKRFEVINEHILIPRRKEISSKSDELQKIMQSIHTTSTHIPLQHNTVNSYYENLHIAKDPAFVGSPSKGTHYECYFRVSQLKHIPSDSMQVYLEFDLPLEPQSHEEWQIILSAPIEGWQHDTITYNTRPSTKEIASILISQPFSTTVSFDVTKQVMEDGLTRFHLRSTAKKALLLDQVRLTCFQLNK
ncbi:glycosyltransferase involved in cell wall biosynthesis [Croceifilum oryzae]|uniref:Glycosyltransferase involved in cell wall biosynthesis n=1 Tax=Croceifilum oryzae TaxID=1553429 RepID=A0AAJ1TJ88_9BACL|nr:glycosyltransferase [Croceifilum oryzae]MDQ0417004.1 glycosyltransferase involved in cell wall biosynthesis [Croceifilum oryzae]